MPHGRNGNPYWWPNASAPMIEVPRWVLENWAANLADPITRDWFVQQIPRDITAQLDYIDKQAKRLRRANIPPEGLPSADR